MTWRDWINTVQCMDCLEGMKQMPEGCVDLVVTDPPYDVGFTEWDTKIEGWFEECQRVSAQLIFTPGIRNILKHPQADWVICWAKPGSTRRNDTGGFNHWEPLLYYGDNKIMVDHINIPFGAGLLRNSKHPCPKPLKLYRWLVDTLSDPGDLILDPFMGSGTTAVACKQLGRRFIGFEINPKYVGICKQRLAQGVLKLETQR